MLLGGVKNSRNLSELKFVIIHEIFRSTKIYDKALVHLFVVWRSKESKKLSVILFEKCGTTYSNDFYIKDFSIHSFIITLILNIKM